MLIDFRLVVILLLVVRGSEGFLPTPPSWPELLMDVYFSLLFEIVALSPGFLLVACYWFPEYFALFHFGYLSFFDLSCKGWGLRCSSGQGNPLCCAGLVVLVDFFFNSLVVGVPCSLIFWHFWLFIDFRLVVILLLVV